ncbi:MAG: HAD family phosphatase, partial [Actinomycetota bacterium]
LVAYSGGADQLVFDFETGRIQEAEFAERFAERINEVTGFEVPHEGLVARVFAGLSLEEDMLSALETTRAAGFKTAMLSNSWGESLYPRERLDHLFDVMVISGEIGMRKPDREIFDATIERLGVPAEASIFVDDHPGHLQTAAELGMTTVLHRSPAETLAELGELLNLELTLADPAE